MKRRGSVYLMVLLTSAFVLASGLAALSIEERSHKRADLSGEVGSARIAMRAGLDLGLQFMEENPTWRAGVGGNDRLLDLIIDSGGWEHSVRVFAVDPDGNLAENNTDPFTLTVKSSRGRSKRTLNVTVRPRAIPMDVLELGVYTEGSLITQSGASLTGNAPAGSRKSTDGTGSTFYVPLETEGTASGATYLAEVVEAAEAREAPVGDLVGLYAGGGVLIREAELTLRSGSYVLDQMVIGPGLNPFGSGVSSPTGVYLINQGTTKIIIRDSRILGTLVFIGSGDVVLENSVNWAPATAGEPALLTAAPVVFRMTSAKLSESITGVNFNPPGLGGSGDEDLDHLDAYPSELQGIVHTGSYVTIESGVNTIRGTLICRGNLTVESSGTLDLQGSRDSLDQPPAGFESSSGLQMNIVKWLEP